MTDTERIALDLAAPFRANQVKWRPGAVGNDRAQAMPYIDARLVQQRLDKVVGIAGWKSSFDFLPSGDVVCTLWIFLNGEWITKQDVGKPSKQPDAGDKTKAAVSDAFKRTAVSWGIGRYLYFIPKKWVAYDSQKKILKEVPALPEWATPEGYARQHDEPKPTMVAQSVTTQSVTALPEWFTNIETKLIKNDLAHDGEVQQYVLDACNAKTISQVDEKSGRQALEVFGRRRLEHELQAQIDRVKVNDWAEILRIGNLSVSGKPASELSDVQMFSCIKGLRLLPAPAF